MVRQDEQAPGAGKGQAGMGGQDGPPNVMRHYYMRFATAKGFTAAYNYLFPNPNVYWQAAGRLPNGKGYEISVVLY